MKKPYYSINQEVHYLRDNKVKTDKIKGIATFEGVVDTLHNTHKVKEGDIKTIYYFGNYSGVEEIDIFPTLDSLKESLFPKEPVTQV